MLNLTGRHRLLFILGHFRVHNDIISHTCTICYSTDSDRVGCELALNCPISSSSFTVSSLATMGVRTALASPSSTQNSVRGIHCTQRTRIPRELPQPERGLHCRINLYSLKEELEGVVMIAAADGNARLFPEMRSSPLKRHHVRPTVRYETGAGPLLLRRPRPVVPAGLPSTPTRSRSSPVL